MEQLRGIVQRITFHSEENGYSVIKCKAKGYRQQVAVVGTIPNVHIGSVLILSGEWKVDRKYGRQFVASSYEEELPATVYGIEQYLGSGLIKGIGPKYAHKIVSAFGKDTLRILDEEPERLYEIEGIGKNVAARVQAGWEEQKEIKDIMLFLQSHDVSTGLATRIFKTYGADSVKVVQENPYRLAEEVKGIGFRTADLIAMKMGFEKDLYVRLRSGLFYSLSQLATEGHCYALRDQLIKTGEALLEVEEPLLQMTLDEMIKARDLVTEESPEGKILYLAPFFIAEQGTARRLAAIAREKSTFSIPLSGLQERIARESEITYDQDQMSAICMAAANKILILTGGPGTGKTTVTKGILSIFSQAHAKILLAAPTGRAAKRLSEVSGMQARTIHRLLEAAPPDVFNRNNDNPLEGDVLLVDEASMIDLILFYHLLKAMPPSMRLILVGDVDQLPSVGPGNVLRDLIDCGCFPVVRLTHIFRQAQASRIVQNAHRINRGEMPDLSNGMTTDFFFMERKTPEAAAETIVELVRKKLPAYYKVPWQEIQVLSPMQRGEVGTVRLNELLQQALNPVTQGINRGGQTFCVGDKVMQIRNDYEKEVFNGDIGIVEATDFEERRLTVNFEGRFVSYEGMELEELTLAYATTIHKAQGSEYPIVIIPVMMNHSIMLWRNLLYTGITRARKILVLVGTRQAVEYCVRNKQVTKRNTMLAKRIRNIVVGSD